MYRFTYHLATVSLVLLIALSSSAASLPARQPFGVWLKKFRQEARASGISPHTLRRALGDVHPLPQVVELDRHQPEQTQSYRHYLQRVVSKGRIMEGRRQLRKNRYLLKKLAAKTGVRPSLVVALWGIETDFGGNTGSFPVIDALATLAYDGRRRHYFRNELLDALMILGQEKISRRVMRGSWAGAMGQVQFMPSTYRRFAVDFDGDGRRDIWHSRADALASAANYLVRSGWHRGQGWGEEISLPRSRAAASSGLHHWRSLRAWRRRGVRGVRGPERRRAALLLPDGLGGPSFLVFRNFRVLLRWNHSTYFCLAAGQLADAIGRQGAAER